MNPEQVTAAESGTGGLWRAQRLGLVIQAALFVSMLAQNLVAPRLLGARDYAVFVVLVSAPNLVVGLAEPLFSSLMIRLAAGPDAAAARALRAAVVLTALGGVAALVFAVAWGGDYAAKAGAPADIAADLLLAAYAAVALVNPMLLGLGFSGEASRRLPLAYLASAACALAGLALIPSFGVLAALAAYAAAQVVMFAAMGGFPALRQALRRTAADGPPAGPGFALAPTLVAAMAPRLMVTLVSTISVLVASARLPAADLAVFRVDLTLLNAAQYLTPISAPLLQRTFGQGRAGEGRALALMLAGVAALGVVLAAGFVAFEPLAIRIILGGAAPTRTHGAVLAAAPFYMLIAPLASALLARRRDGRLLAALAVAFAAFALAFALSGLDAAILASCGAFAAAAAFALR